MNFKRERRGVLREIDFDESELDKMRKFLSSKNPTKNYSGMGLRYPVSFLNELGGYAVLLPLEMMADLVDVVTKHHVDTKSESVVDYMLNNKKMDYSVWNATSIGNMAYVHLNCHSLIAKERAFEYLDGFYNWFKPEEKAETLNKIINN